MRSESFATVGGDDDPSLGAGPLRHIAQLHAAVFVFYAIDGVLLTAFGGLGLLPRSFGALYAGAGWLAAGVAVLAFRRGRRTVRSLELNNVVMTACATAQMLVTASIAPSVGALMLMSLMTVLAASALQLAKRNRLVTWAACACGTLAAVVLAGAEPFEFPMATSAQRLLSTGWFAWLLGKCALINVEGTRLRQRVNEANSRLVRAFADLEKIATTDELTVIPNRRSIVSGLHAALDTAAACPGSVAVALFDIDHFKRVNDRFGHATGDAVLREFAALVSRGLRPTDSVGRYGGEEFLLVLQQVRTAATARETADRMRRTIEAFDWSALGRSLAVTASAGVALLERGESAESVIARADRALYQAKADGRNRVVLS